MGSVIAWHVLTGIVPFVPIDTLITIGSPLGLPVIRGRLLEENRKTGIESTSLKTPENIVHNWYNLSDQKDPITMDYSLGDIFEANSRGVKVIDRNVHNDYEYNTVKNHHKVYGYLRTPELAEITKSFLKRTPFRAWARIKDLLGLKY
jgi:hypothetical protein